MTCEGCALKDCPYQGVSSLCIKVDSTWTESGYYVLLSDGRWIYMPDEEGAVPIFLARQEDRPTMIRDVLQDLVTANADHISQEEA